MTSLGILIVDDDPDIHICLTELLKAWMPHTPVDAVDSGEAALQRLASNDYAVVLIDLILPDMSGVQLARCLQATRPCLPAILMSATPEFKGCISAVTVVAYFAKPFNRDRLLHILVRAFEHGHRFREG